MDNKKYIIEKLKKACWNVDGTTVKFPNVKFNIRDEVLKITSDRKQAFIRYKDLIGITDPKINEIISTFEASCGIGIERFLKKLASIIREMSVETLIPKPQNEIPKRYQTQSGKNFMEILKNEMLTHDEYIGFLKGNVYKYVFRYQKKNGKEDLEKAQTYLKLLEDEANG